MPWRFAGDGDVSAIVVGAGISGAFAADTLRTRLGPELRLDVLEREARTGGRAFRRRVSGVEVETGASLFHSSNRLLARSATELGLHLIRADSRATLGIWDGSEVVFRTRGRRHGDTLRMLARYRLPLLRAGREVGRLVRGLEHVFPRLERGESWDTPEQLLSDLSLYQLSQERAGDHFPPGRFATEFLDGVCRNNYAQDCEELNALVELVSLAGAGLGGGTLLRVGEGNDAMGTRLLARSGAQLRTAAVVNRVERTGTRWRVSGDGFTALEADIVVLAAPLELARIHLVAVPTPPPRRFVAVHVSFVHGGLRPPARSAGQGRPPLSS